MSFGSSLRKNVVFVVIFLSALITSSHAKESTSKQMNPKEFKNRLSQEKSPYLLQHADNPVDWYPWGDEAFEQAKKENKPIFLSIGYSTCHWCHVMEHESFEDVDVAQKINEYFIPVKVDREERPDIDNIYMTAVMAMTGRGGWPLTVILTPDKKPFFGGTYFPPHAKWGTPGLVDLMNSIHQSWTNNRAQLESSSVQLTEMLRQRIDKGGDEGTLSPTVFDVSYRQFSAMYDHIEGGFGSEPKFPTSHNLSFLLRYWQRSKEDQALQMVEQTLIKMAYGGMYDHLGGGFHRYSTDAAWQIPHFEKMLYDQAILSRTYLEAYQITRNEYYAEIAREIFDYVLRDLHHPQGGFYSAEDADSYDPEEYAQATEEERKNLEKGEGSFYLWKFEEIDSLLEKDAAEIFMYHYGIKPDGNAKTDPHGEFIGKNVIYIEYDLEQTADKFNTTADNIKTIIEESKRKLFDVRNKRPHSHLDDKILVDWNGLMISSLAFGANVLNEPIYREAAQKAADFIIEKMITKEGRLLHRYRDGEAAKLGMIEDYAFLSMGLLDLYETTWDFKYLQRAQTLIQEMVKLFWDEDEGGFYFTGDDGEKLLFRQKEIYDGAIPSGNSMAAHVLVKMYHITFDEQWKKYYERLFNTFSVDIEQRPSAYSQMLMAFDHAVGPSQEIVFAVAKNEQNLSQLLSAVYDRFLPNKVVLINNVESKEAADLATIAPFIKEQSLIQDQTTVYVCENQVCQLPVNKVEALSELLDKIGFKKK